SRTTGGTAGAATFDTTVPFDHTVHFHVVRIRFDASATCTAPSVPCTACPGGGACNVEVTLFIDPDLSVPGTPADATATLGPLIVADLGFDTIETGAESEAVDVDELRIGTTFDSVAPRTGIGPVDAGTPLPDLGTPAPDLGTPVDLGSAPTDLGSSPT